MSLSDFNYSDADVAAAEAETVNSYLSDPAKGLQLITRLIAHPPSLPSRDPQKHLAHLHQLIHQSFVSLAARDDYPAEAQAFRELLALEESLEDLTLFPDLANKTIVGVGGGFSAGKSRFLNTLMGDALLPESLEPTTAIPSFLTGGEAKIVALNAFNHSVEIDADALQAISHAFYTYYQKNYGVEVGFAHVLKLLMIHRPAFHWKNLAFLDTPGYSKAEGDDSGQTDEKIALKQLTEADHVIWLLNAKNGSIRRDDLEFLRTLNHPKPIFFVITQADLVGETRIQAILKSTSQAIKEAGISSAGLMAWAAPLGVLNGERIAGDDILNWLDSPNAAPKYTTKRRICAVVLDKYILHNSNALANNRSLLSALNELLPLVTPMPEKRNAAITKTISEMESLQTVIGKLAISKKSASSVLGAYGLGSVAESAAWSFPGLLDREKNRELAKTKIEDNVSNIINRLKEFSQPLDTPVLEKQRKTIITEIDRLKNDQRRLSSLVQEFTALKHDMLESITHIVGKAEIRDMDEHNVTFAITNPNATE